MKTILRSLVLAGLAATLVTSCNTIRGADRDVENVGSAIGNLGR